MSTHAIHHFRLANGLTVIVEEMTDVQSAAFALLIPAGTIYEVAGKNGVATALADLLTRGAGDRDSRSLSAALDRLGVQRGEQAGWNFLSLTGAMLGDKLPSVLGLYAEIVQRPRLAEEEFEPVMAGLEQSLLALEDEPQRKLMTELRRRTYRSPWGRPVEGSLDDLDAITLDDLREHYRRCVQPAGAILGVAGRVDAAVVRQSVERLFSDWAPAATLPVTPGDSGPRVDHITHDSTQTQIGVAYAAPPFGHGDYYSAWAAASILGGGASARLFTEVRERRGLCYSVQSSLNSLLTEGRTLVYAGTSADRAQETLDVLFAEIARLAEGVSPEELARCQARAKSSLIMQQESTGARASSLARDWFHLGRVTTLDEVRRAVEDVTVDGVLEAARRTDLRHATILTLGPRPLQPPG